MVQGYITVNSISIDVIQGQVVYKDELAISRTDTLTSSITGTGHNSFTLDTIRALANNPITVNTVLTTGAGSINYDAGCSLIKVTTT
jgi:hypothetical protein